MLLIVLYFLVLQHIVECVMDIKTYYINKKKEITTWKYILK